EREPRDQVEPPSVERHLLAVDVVIAGPPAGQREGAVAERSHGDELAQLVTQAGVDRGCHGVHRSMGWRAARTSSTRLTGVSWGACWTKARSRSASSTMAAQIPANASRLCFDSVSVGSNINASGTVSGK